MRSLTIALLLCAAAAPALATTTRTDTVTASVHKTGRSGSSLVYKGTVHSKVFGTGKVTEYIGITLRGRFVIQYRRGTVRGTSVAHITHSGGSGLDVNGTYRLTGGSGRYKHVSGHGSFTGHSTADESRATFRQHGKVSF